MFLSCELLVWSCLVGKDINFSVKWKLNYGGKMFFILCLEIIRFGEDK